MRRAAPTFSQVCVDAGITQGADHGVGAPIGILNLFARTDVCRVDRIALRADTHEQVVRLDVSVYVLSRMNVLEARNELIREQQHSLQGELPSAVVEEVLQTGSQELECHHPVLAFRAVPVYSWDAVCAIKVFVDLDLVFELRRADLVVLEFERDFFAGFKVMACTHQPSLRKHSEYALTLVHFAIRATTEANVQLICVSYKHRLHGKEEGNMSTTTKLCLLNEYGKLAIVTCRNMERMKR